MSTPGRRIAVIIPVRDMADHLEQCVRTLVPQLGAGDEVIVVDDGSTDDGVLRAEAAGARVVPNRGDRGPYGARNHGATITDAPLLLFIDARCRARPGLLDAHRDLLARDGVALSCTDVAVARQQSFAGRVAWVQDSFRVAKKIHGSVLDFYPTANLGVSHSTFDAVGGFRAVRSGADADFCWRVQRSDLGEIAADYRELMMWEPRNRVRDLIEQNHRYGRSGVFLERLHATTMSAASPSSVKAARRQIHVEQAAPAIDPSTDRLADFGSRVLNLTVRAGRLYGLWEHRNVVADDGLPAAESTLTTRVEVEVGTVSGLSSWQSFRADCARYREDARVSRWFWWIDETSIWAVAAFRLGGTLREVLPRAVASPVLALYELTFMPLVRMLTGVELPLNVMVGPGVRIYRGVGVVLGADTVIGARCVLRQGVNIGHVLNSDKSPRIGDDVDLGAYSQVLGGVTIGDRVKIGPASVVFGDVPADATAFGVPARVTANDNDSAVRPTAGW